MENDRAIDLKYLFEPRSVAIIGASNGESKAGGMFVRSLLRDQFPGDVYPVNPKEKEIMGLKCRASVLEIPGGVDLAILAIPAPAMPLAIEQCARKKVRFAIAHAAGFSEMGNAGRELEKRMTDAAGKGSTRIIGPNCMGIFSSRGRVNTIVPHSCIAMEPGGVSFIGQSGWASEVFLQHGSQRGLGLSNVVSIGNQSDLTLEDVIAYWADDPDTRVIAAYIEGLKDPQRFMNVARKVSRRKPVIVWKGGSSDMGVRSAASHTGSLAGSYRSFQTMCRQSGIIAASGMADVLDLSVAFSCPVLPAGNRVGLLIEAGGAAVASADACEREGLAIREFSRKLQSRLAEYLKDKVPPSNNRKNPVDVVWAPVEGGARIFVDCLEMIIPEVDACLVMPYAFLHDNLFRKKMVEIRDKVKKPLIIVPANATDQVIGSTLAVMDGLPVYTMPEDAVRCIGAMWRRAEFLKKVK